MDFAKGAGQAMKATVARTTAVVFILLPSRRRGRRSSDDGFSEAGSNFERSKGHSGNVPRG
jgi:hypothetical protein